MEEGGGQDGMGGESSTATTRMTTTLHSNGANMNNRIICLFILQLMSCQGSHATAHKSTEYQHDIHGLDVLLCGEDGLSG
jgi:hypothetical protein